MALAATGGLRYTPFSRWPGAPIALTLPGDKVGAGWSSPVARQAHNLKVRGSNPLPAPNFPPKPLSLKIGREIGDAGFLRFGEHLFCDLAILNDR